MNVNIKSIISKGLITATLVRVMTTPLSVKADFSKGYIERLDGDTRVETSIEISKEIYPSTSSNAVIVGYNGSVDALSGTMLASEKDAPVIMTRQNRLSKETKEELLRLKTKTAYVLGGENVVSEEVVKEIQGMGITVLRLAGDNRAETSVNIAKEVKGNKADKVFLTTGWAHGGSNSLADALAVGPVSGKLSQPILLTQSHKLPKSTKEALKELNVKEITIIGGYVPVSKEVEDELKKEYKVNRIQGDNREKTAIKVSDEYFGKLDKVVMANGYNSVDALLGGYAGAKLDAPIIFTNTERVSNATEEFLYQSQVVGGFILGGESVLTEDVRESIMNSVMRVKESNTKTPINVETPEPYKSLSGQTTHPDVIYVEDGWNGHKYWMVHTPYHNTDETLENPAVSYSDDGVNFYTLEGATNPIDSPKEGLQEYRAHMSDADFLIKPDGTMEVYYRYRDREKGKGEIIFRKTSKDGISWTDREVVMKGYTDTGKDILSPALMYEEGQYRMWWVDQTSVYTSTSRTALEGTWSPKQKVELEFQGKEMNPWHLDVFKDKGKHYLLLNVNESDIHSQRSLVLGESEDGGLSFGKIKTIMRPTESRWDNRDIYRGSIIEVDGVYKLYYSGMSKDRKWYVGLSESEDMTYWKGQHQ